ncbi:MAG: HNH endonuclease [Thermoanaerobaculia bacterium]
MGYAPTGLEWDHRDRDPLNNRRDNLRLVTKSVNQRNKRLSKTNRSGVAGVCWHRGACKWIVQIKVKGRIQHLGYYSEFDQAVVARRAGEQRYWT